MTKQQETRQKTMIPIEHAVKIMAQRTIEAHVSDLIFPMRLPTIDQNGNKGAKEIYSKPISEQYNIFLNMVKAGKKLPTYPTGMHTPHHVAIAKAKQFMRREYDAWMMYLDICPDTYADMVASLHLKAQKLYKMQEKLNPTPNKQKEFKL